MSTQRTQEWTIAQKREETHDVVSLVLKAEGERPPFIAGQYLTVMLQGFEPAEGKSYSISSTPADENITLTIKTMGNFSRALLAKKVGDTIITSFPYGFFYPEPDEQRNLAFVVGGIGITPCMSIIRAILAEKDGKNDPRALTLFYSNKTAGDIVFRDDLTALARDHKNLTVHHFITRETPTDTTLKRGRMTADTIAMTLGERVHETDFFVCGSIQFTKSLWKDLRDVGTPSTQLYTEGFF